MAKHIHTERCYDHNVPVTKLACHYESEIVVPLPRKVLEHYGREAKRTGRAVPDFLATLLKGQYEQFIYATTNQHIDADDED